MIHMTHPRLSDSLAVEVKRRMTLLGLSARQLAADTNIPSPTLGRRLLGAPFTTAELELVAGRLGCSLVELIAAAEADVAA